jgi:DNA-binding NtrC family response regulator
MSPEKAKIFFVEDDVDSREDCAEYLKSAGHTIVETATTIEEAMNKIPTLDQKGINIAIVDGNLSKDSYDGSEGEFIAEEIKKQHPNIVVIGHSLKKPLNNADVNSIKMENNEKLVEVVTKA